MSDASRPAGDARQSPTRSPAHDDVPYLSLCDLRTGAMLEFKLGFVRLGRDPGCELRVEGEGAGVVSSLHAQFGDRGGSWMLEDLFSRNGTLVDGSPVPPGRGVAIAEGQVVQLGRTGPQFRVMRTTQRMTAATLVEAPLDNGAVAVLQQWQASGPHAPVTRPSGDATPSPTESTETPDELPATAPPPEPDRPWLELALADRDTPFALTRRSARIGRSPSCELILPEAPQSPVSRVHAELAVRPDGSVLVVDAGSTHGTYVNGERVELARALAVGDVITLGRSGPSLTVRALRGHGLPA